MIIIKVSLLRRVYVSFLFFFLNYKVHNNRILERRDGTYQEVEFSFKPNNLSKGSHRYTSEGENGTAAKEEPRASLENLLTEHRDNLEIDIDLIKNIPASSPKFIGSPLSMNQVRFGTSSSKSSAICNKNSPRISPHNRDRDFILIDNTQMPSSKRSLHDESPVDIIPKNILKPINTHFIGDTGANQAIKKRSRDLPFIPPSSSTSRQPTAPVKNLHDRKTSLQIAPLNYEILPPNYLNVGTFYEKNQSKQDSKENKPTLDMAVIQGVTKLDTKKPQTTRNTHKPVRSHVGDNTLRDIRRGSNPLNSPALRENHLMYQLQSFTKESEASYSATRVLKDHNILKKISNQATNMSKDSKRSSASLKQNSIKKSQQMKVRLANTFIEQPPESFHLDDSIARLEKRKQSIFDDLKTNKAKPAEYYRVQIKDTYCVSPMVGRNHSFVCPVQSVKNANKIQVIFS